MYLLLKSYNSIQIMVYFGLHTKNFFFKIGFKIINVSQTKLTLKHKKETK